METNIRVFLVHSDDVIREGVRHLLHFYQGIEVVGEAPNVERALASVAHLAPDVLVIEPKTNATTRAEAIPEFTLSISRDSEGRPLFNMTAYKDKEFLGEVTIVGRQSEHRVQVIDVGEGGYRVLENKGEELANAIMLAAREELPLSMISGDTYRTLIGHESVARGNGEASNGHANGIGNGHESVAGGNGHATNGHQNGIGNGHESVAGGNGHATNGHQNGIGNGHESVAGGNGHASNGHANGTGNGHESVARGNGYASNGHANGTGNGHVDTEGAHPGTNGYEYRESNEQPVTEGAYVEHVTQGWFGAVTTREAKPLEGTADEDGPPPAEGLPRDLPEGTKITHDPTIHWETPQQEEEQESDEPWMNLWKPPAHRDAAGREPPAEVELVLPHSVRPQDLYNFVLDLKRATRAEIIETSGSLTGATSIKVLVDRSVPLLEIMRAMPDVAGVEAEITEQYGWGRFVSSPYLPQKVSVDLTPEGAGYEDNAKQLELAL